MKIANCRFLITSLSVIFTLLVANLPVKNTVLAEDLQTISQSINKKQISLKKAEFGVRIVDSHGNINFFPTKKVPLKKGDAYGWRITLKNYRGKVTWREVLSLPKVPETWSTSAKEENFSLSDDGTTAITKRTQNVTNGVIENYWKIAPGDPLGKHKIEVYVDNSLIATFEFETVEF